MKSPINIHIHANIPLPEDGTITERRTKMRNQFVGFHCSDHCAVPLFFRSLPARGCWRLGFPNHLYFDSHQAARHSGDGFGIPPGRRAPRNTSLSWPPFLLLHDLNTLDLCHGILASAFTHVRPTPPARPPRRTATQGQHNLTLIQLRSGFSRKKVNQTLTCLVGCPQFPQLFFQCFSCYLSFPGRTWVGHHSSPPVAS